MAVACVCPASNCVLLTRDVGGSEFHQVYELSLDAGNCRLLTDGTSRNLGMLWNRRGDRFAYASTRRNGHGHDLLVAVGYMLARDEGHGFRRKQNRDVFDQAAAHFIEQFVLAEEGAAI